MKKYYVLIEDPFMGPFAFGDLVDPVLYGDSPKCSQCGYAIGSKEWLHPRRIKLAKGVKTNKPGDIIFGVFDDFVASNKFRGAWEREGLQGITEWRPVEIIGCRDKDAAYYYPSFKPAAARADFVRTKVAWGKKGPPTCKECLSEGRGKDAIKGIYLIENSIPTDDIFHAKGLIQIIASYRFKQFAEEHHLLNIDLVPTEHFVWDPNLLLD